MNKLIFEGEEIIKKWDNCTLTNKRVWYSVEAGGDAEYRGFPVSQFQGATIGKVSYPWLMYLGVAICALSFLMLLGNSSGKFGAFVGTLIFGGIVVAVWHFTKRAEVLFCSSQIKIQVHLHANEKDYNEAISFVSEIEKVALNSRAKSISAA
ncbi:hypothetical protein [Bdellovibrio sp. HCB209]|uniref:hypothetical protein n=1 Tax=Bdellovibrio sp. HCB209 TaxID=3394354 RepID=UPI0039B373CC